MIGGIILDVTVLAIAVLLIILNTKRGFFKSFMSLVSGVASVVLAYTFTPALSGLLKDRFFLGKLSGSISGTFATLCENGNAYDVSKLIGNGQFDSIVESYGADGTKIEKLISGIKDTSYSAVEKVSDAVADKLAGTVSRVISFVLILVVSLIALKVITYVVGLIFKLPVIRTFDRGFGLIFGIAGAVLFIYVMSEIVYGTGGILKSVIPDTFKGNIADSTVLLKAVSKIKAVELIG